MPLISVTRRDGSVGKVEAETSTTLMEVLRDNGFEIEALCGGCCSCATCQVFIDPAFADVLPQVSDDERTLLEDSSHYDPVLSRLSCQIRITDDMKGLAVTVAPAD